MPRSLPSLKWLTNRRARISEGILKAESLIIKPQRSHQIGGSQVSAISSDYLIFAGFKSSAKRALMLTVSQANPSFIHALLNP
jgi:hypothetical protein